MALYLRHYHKWRAHLRRRIEWLHYWWAGRFPVHPMLLAFATWSLPSLSPEGRHLRQRVQWASKSRLQAAWMLYWQLKPRQRRRLVLRG